MMLAAQNGHLAIVRALVEYWPDSVSDCDKKGRTILSLAALYGHHQIVEFLCEDRFLNKSETSVKATTNSTSDIAKHAMTKLFTNIERGLREVVALSDSQSLYVDMEHRDRVILTYTHTHIHTYTHTHIHTPTHTFTHTQSCQ